MHVLFRGVELVDAFYMRLCTELSEPNFRCVCTDCTIEVRGLFVCTV